MERERFFEMMENLKRLSEEGILGVPVYLFAHCGATMELADELIKIGIRPSAILDNNPDKYGLDYKGIPVCEPDAAVRSEATSDAIILIVSRFYEQMASQMRGLGFKGRIEKLTDYNTYAEYSLSPDTLIRKSERLKRGIERLASIKDEHKDAFVVLCPFPALGDVYFCMSYLKPYMDMIGCDSALVCVVGNAQRQVAELFDYGEEGTGGASGADGEDSKHLKPLKPIKLDVLKLDQKDMDEVIQAVIYTDDPDCYIAHQDRPYVVDLHRALKVKRIPLETIYKCGIFGLPQDTCPALPVNWDEFEYPADSYGSKVNSMDDMDRVNDKGRVNDKDSMDDRGEKGGEYGKIAIISPYAKSVASLSDELWADMVDDLRFRGYEVYTNVVGDEKPLAETKAISPTIAEMKSAVEQAGLFIGIRSGMCDVIRTADCKKIALYPDYFYCDTKWKSIDMYSIDGFENIVVKDGDTWEEVKKRINWT